MQSVTQRQLYYTPHDWRVRTLSSYNEILLKIGREMNIPIIGTYFIIAPISDSYTDFMHPEYQFFWTEYNHIMRELINLTHVLCFKGVCLNVPKIKLDMIYMGTFI